MNHLDVHLNFFCEGFPDDNLRQWVQASPMFKPPTCSLEEHYVLVDVH